tara:strand:+ start:5479 stop:5925 length:447 start_codon:yes stop_codon:yes gene_type:complete
MVKTKKRNKKSHNKTKKKNNKQPHYIIGFFDAYASRDDSSWNADYFGYRKLIPINQFKTIQSIDYLNLATDYKKNPKVYKYATAEYRRRLILQLKDSPSSRKIFEKKTKKKYNSKRIHKIVDKMPIDKLQKLYFLLLEKEKPIKLRKK